MPVMPLDSLASGTDVLVDTNILIYALLESSAQCRRFFNRCVNEVCHRLMLAEALRGGLVSSSQAKLLRAKRAAIPTLFEYWTKTQQIFQFGLLVVGLDEARIRRAQEM